MTSGFLEASGVLGLFGLLLLILAKRPKVFVDWDGEFGEGDTTSRSSSPGNVSRV